MDLVAEASIITLVHMVTCIGYYSPQPGSGDIETEGNYEVLKFTIKCLCVY